MYQLVYFTRGSNLKHTYSELFMQRNTECKGSIVKHTIQGMENGLREKLVPETPINDTVQQKI